jgi:hypothetical protein
MATRPGSETAALARAVGPDSANASVWQSLSAHQSRRLCQVTRSGTTAK